MQWIEISVPTGGLDIDEISRRLIEMGVEGLVIEDETDFEEFLRNNNQYWDYVDEELSERFRALSRIKFYALDDDGGRTLAERVRGEFSGVSSRLIDEEDWGNNWRAYYEPIEVGKRLVIVPEWQETPPGDRLPVRLDPGLIFGTGSHATTRMCLELLDETDPRGLEVLDLGSGSGILGIAALRLGALRVTGCDVDPKAPDVACANAGLNGFGPEHFRVLAGDAVGNAALRREFGAGYDLVLCNIVADVIIALAPYLPGFLRPGGVLITSGVIGGREAETVGALLAAGLELGESREAEDWHAFTFRRPE